MRKLYLILILALILCLFGCNEPIGHANDDANDTQIESQNNDSGSADIGTEEHDSVDVIIEQPIIQEFYIHCEKDSIADLYVKELYDSILLPVAIADENDIFHSASVVSISDLTTSTIKGLVYFIDYNTHVYSGEGTDFSFYYELDDMTETVESVFGAGVAVDTEQWEAGGNAFIYEENLRRFGGEPSFGGDYPIKKIVGYFGKYEIVGDYLYIYDRVLYCDHDRWGTGIIKFYSDINKTDDSFVNEMNVGSYLPEDFSNDEALEQYGAEYKHTFKLAEDGVSYYWVSSEPILDIEVLIRELHDTLLEDSANSNILNMEYVSNFSSYEQDGEFIYVYNKILRSYVDSYSGITYIYSSFDETNSEVIYAVDTQKYRDGESTIDSKYFEEYGVKYKHIFKQREDGTYYWISSEPIK